MEKYIKKFEEYVSGLPRHEDDRDVKDIVDDKMRKEKEITDKLINRVDTEITNPQEDK
ncbi:hypothetical protein [Taibaiella sp. KBW10]|uniref:hypothetical protein n=1 Tax=Taibaiella sp. KBW10 TaxID=2153357 RepID=UPI001315404B|nr:hypothetical protein [Taibaiella sp. KBW10]